MDGTYPPDSDNQSKRKDGFPLTANDTNESPENLHQFHLLLLSDCKDNNVETPIAGEDDHEDDDIPVVSIDEGAFKYILITATSPPPSKLLRTFVCSREKAQYHVNIVLQLLPKLRSHGYTDILVAGGGRINRDDKLKKIHIFGYSYGFGMADHAAAKEVVEQSVKYREYEVTW
jgi:phosphohistidine phosphatase